ncbi:MAG: MarR family transcriptional regulator [Leifsonia sp.]
MMETALSTRQTAGEIRALAGKLRRRLREQADAGEFTTAQASVVIRIEREGPATGTELARAEGMKPQSMGAILVLLEERGVLVGHPDPGDGRKTIWSITPEARRTIDQARATKEDWLLRTIESRLTAEEQRRLAEGVHLLSRLLEP